MSNTIDVLVVDDDPFIRELLLEVLVEAGYSVRGAASGAEALAILATTTPRLLVTDLMMPEMSGEQLIEQVQAHGPPGMAIVSISAHVWDRRSAIPGTTAFLAKPFDIEAFLTLVTPLLAKDSDSEKMA